MADTAETPKQLLHLVFGGELKDVQGIEFKDLDMLCGQCHGKIYAAWQAGAYGKRVGSWDGEKRYFSCTECHDPHQPRFEAIRPDPVPMRPDETLQ